MAGRDEDGSWGKVVTLTVVACLLVGGALWFVVPKGAPVKNATPPPSSQAQERSAAAARQVDKSLDPDRPTKAERLEARLGKPPKLSVQLSDPMAGVCEPFFNVSLVVRVIRGEFDDIVAEVRIPHDKMTRTRTLMYADGDWTATIGGLPVNRTITLLVMASGPDGQETISKDITHVCPGAGLDDDPHDLVGRDARQELRENLRLDFGG